MSNVVYDERSTTRFPVLLQRLSRKVMGVELSTLLSWVWAGLAASALIIAGMLRFASLGNPGFNSDEAVYSGQAAALAGDPTLGEFFSVFRAHPLFVQSLLAVLFRAVGVSDVMARAFVAIVFGLGGIVAAALLARALYGREIAIVSGVLLALLPYHVLLSRQVLLDVPVTLLLTLTVWLVYRFTQSGDPRWLLGSAPVFGLAVVTKETALLLAPALLLFLVWSKKLHLVQWRHAFVWAAMAGLSVAPFLLSRALFGGETGGSYFLYQFSRPPNHSWWYFPVVLWSYATVPLLATSGTGLAVMVWRRREADKILLCWLAVFGLFFQVWPTKLFPYAVAVVPVLIISAAIGISAIAGAIGILRTGDTARKMAFGALTALLAVPLATTSLRAIAPPTDAAFQGPFHTDVELQDFAGGREAGRWIGDHTPEGSVLLTIGPSFGNIISFYGYRHWSALSVSPDRRLRNPAYQPIPNPDIEIRSLRIHYAVWDAYSADRSAFFSNRLLGYVRKYSGIPVFSAWLTTTGRVSTGRIAPSAADVRIVVYELVGGDPLSRSMLPNRGDD